MDTWLEMGKGRTRALLLQRIQPWGIPTAPRGFSACQESPSQEISVSHRAGQGCVTSLGRSVSPQAPLKVTIVPRWCQPSPVRVRFLEGEELVPGSLWELSCPGPARGDPPFPHGEMSLGAAGDSPPPHSSEQVGRSCPGVQSIDNPQGIRNQGRGAPSPFPSAPHRKVGKV